MGSNQKVAVLGAGVIGLSTALEFQARFPSAQVTLFADKFDVETTSDGAAGLFELPTSFMGPDVETTKRWIKNSFNHYESLLREDCGVNRISGYVLDKYGDKYSENHYLKPVLPVYHRLTQDELTEISPGDWKHGTYLSTLVIANRKYQPYCIAKFKAAGGTVISRHVSSFSDLGSEFDVIFNCTGLGARELCNDLEVVPIRGQVIRIQDPSIKQFYLHANTWAYIIPCGFSSQVTLGGTRNFGHTNLAVEPTDTESILERCSELRSSLKTYSGPLQPWVGLRPYRSQVRVEYERRPDAVIINPQLKQFYLLADKMAYIIPGRGQGIVTLGGTHDFGDFNTEIDKYDTAAIWARTSAVRPEVLGSRVDGIWVGLRPHRHHVRVEGETRPGGPKIIHNYGHGGYGVTSAPGTARHAVEVFETMHKTSRG